MTTSPHSAASASVRAVTFGALDVAVDRRADGTILIRSTVPVPPAAGLLIDRLAHWATHAPDRTFLAQRRDGGDWERLTYGSAFVQARRIASALLARRLSPERPLAILSGNGLEHALLALAAMSIGQPFAPISPAYSLISSDFGKLKSILASLSPQLIFAADGTDFAPALAACAPDTAEIITTGSIVPGIATTSFASLASHAIDASGIDAARSRVGETTIAKVLFTSGSTGEPKGVITTHGMLVANQAMLRHWFPSFVDEPPILVDWLPWNHVFGGSHNFGLVLANGGTLYIDGGKPVAGGFSETLRNLREIAPTIYFNVPKGYEELVAAMRRAPALRETFFSKLRLTFYSGASLPQHIADELNQHAVATAGERVLMVTGFGSTETAPAALVNTHRNARLGNIGVPLPGVAIKLVPSGDKLEARIKAPSVMPGYWRSPKATAAAFDDEGFYRFGDAFRFANPADAADGLIFDGRVSEDFKLITGTWVSVGPLRARLIAALAPFAKDAVIAGHDRDQVTALIFPDLDACRTHVGSAASSLPGEFLADERLRGAVRNLLQAFAAAATGSSTRVVRLILLDELPSIDAGEITDKGSINQRAVLTRRAALVEALYAEPPPPVVIDAGSGGQL